MFRIKGEYRDIISHRGVPFEDRGWRSNTIVADFGLFMASLLKKEYGSLVGLEYLAVGSGTQNADAFKVRMETFFSNVHGGSSPNAYQEDSYGWVWARKIEGSDMSFLQDGNPTNDITNTLQISLDIEAGTPLDGSGQAQTLEFREFALLGIDGTDSGTLRMVNYVNHGVITKDPTMKLTREIRLKFPVEG